MKHGLSCLVLASTRFIGTTYQNEKGGNVMELLSIIRGLRKATARIAAVLLLVLSSFSSDVFADDNDRRGIPFSVMTQNLYMGTEFRELLTATTFPEFVQAVATTYDNVLATKPDTRMTAIARDIATLKPDLVGLQEASILRTGTIFAPPAENVVSDMLQTLLSKLAELGQRYTVVALLPGLDAEAPSALGVNVRFTVQDAILARTDSLAQDLKLSNPQGQIFANQLIFPSVIGPVSNAAGWASVDVQVRGRNFRFVTTHLAIHPNFDPTVPLAQAQELIVNAGNTALPVVFVGDFNSVANDAANPTHATYQSFINAGFVETWPEKHPVDPGFTCCQAPDVRNRQSLLSARIDLVFVRGGIEVANAHVVGTRQADRIPSGLWPSDHAGVLARLRLP